MYQTYIDLQFDGHIWSAVIKENKDDGYCMCYAGSGLTAIEALTELVVNHPDFKFPLYVKQQQDRNLTGIV